ncbi:FBA domain-containing protein [Artemisia annua]|uniref:FBA domain-containing protein n=1 Tax=Artemisia annua TaxID=35608 RepID=A0A2U1LH38_ARTAN|nr:FBA domain-containing protein [Artemisia annua]
MSKEEEELPKDVIIDILTRVPTKHILRFKSVSKTWNTLFQTPSFVSKHTHNQTQLPALLFTPSDGTTNATGLISLPEAQKPIRIPLELSIPFLNICKPLRVLGTCNGIVCLGVLPICSIILLWNPCTRVFKDLPVSRISRPPNGPIKVVLGFGYDKVDEDYKVLRIVYYGYPLSQVEVYSLGTDSWREVKTSVKFLVFESGSSVFLNGAFHWTALGFEEMNGKKLIVGFGLREEVFKYIMPPKFEVGRGEKFSWNVVAVNGLLGVIGSVKRGTGKTFEVWVMEEYGVVSSWMKYRSFEVGAQFGRSLGCGLNGQVLVEKDDSELVMYDLDSQQIKNIGNHGVAYWSDVFNYVGSLLPIKGGKVVGRFNLSRVTPDPFFVRKMDLTIE